MIVKTGRFGQLTVQPDELIEVPGGLLGFPHLSNFFLVDPGDDTLILWLQSTENRELAFPVLEPKVFRPDYKVRLSAAERRDIEAEDMRDLSVLTILTIPDDVTQMTANLKAPLVVNLKNRKAKQVVLQENEYSVKHLMFRELRAHLMTIQSQAKGSEEEAATSVVELTQLPISNSVLRLEVS